MPQSIYNLYESKDEQRQKRFRRHHYGLILGLLLFLALVGYAAYRYFINMPTTTSQSQVGGLYKTTVAGPQLFKSTYFEFSDTSTWVFSAADSTANKFTYLLNESGVPAHSLTVYVNQTPVAQDDLAVTHVLPVQIVAGNSFSVGALSDNCESLFTPTEIKHIKTVSLSGTSFLCTPDSPDYSAIIGQAGGNYQLQLTRANGQVAQYIIIYHNLSVTPDPTPFVNIMRTFKAI